MKNIFGRLQPFGSDERNCDPVRHLFRRLRRHLPLEGKDWVELVPFLHPSKRAARKIPPLEGRVASGVPRSRMTEEVIFVPLLHPSKQTAIRYDTSSVACGDTFPSRGRTWWNSFRFCVRRNGLLIGTTPLPSPAATPSPRGEGYGGIPIRFP